MQPKILNYIAHLISEGDRDVVRKTVDTFNISRSTVYNYISVLKTENIIDTDGRGKYKLKTNSAHFLYDLNTESRLEEDQVFNADIAPLLQGLDENVFKAWRYAFTEMMNNAIEHAAAKQIFCLVEQTALDTVIAICDNGMGIFRNIQQYFEKVKGEKLTFSECAALLLAGKFTTAESGHSGEGIFFTSHLMDEFFIKSGGVIFSRTNFDDFHHVIRPGEKIDATIVFMKLSNKTKKTVKDIFDLFADVDLGFYRTSIPVAHMFPHGSPVSRSEARRLITILEQFKEATLDFSDVPEVGQAFAHELFVVWKRRAPNVNICVKNMNDTTERMVKRVKVDAGIED